MYFYKRIALGTLIYLRENIAFMNILRSFEFILHIIIIIGYAYGLLPFGYMFTFWLVIPAIILTIVVSLLRASKTAIYNLVNILMAILGMIPLFGLVFRIIGIIMSVLSLSELSKK